MKHFGIFLLFLTLKLVNGLSFQLMSKRTPLKRMNHVNHVLEQNSKHYMTNKSRSNKRQKFHSKELAEYHVVHEECKIKLNDDGRRALVCKETDRALWNSIGLLTPIHDAVKWLNEN